MTSGQREDQVVKALLTAIATLVDLAEGAPGSTTALSTLEGVAFELGEMSPAEHGRFLEALERIAQDESGSAAWIRDLPDKLGLPPAG